MSVLKIHGLTKSFGGLIAVDEVDITVKQGEILGLIGPNGSGKTTLFNCLTGLYEADKGKILFKNEDIVGFSPYKIAQKGIARTFQLARVFRDLTLFENMVLAQNHLGEKFLRTPTKCFDQPLCDLVDYWLEFVGLSRLRNELAGEVSYGQQKLLEFTMILMPDPELILLDEPTSGVNPVMINKIMSLIRKLHDQGRTMFIIEHNMKVVMNLCERIYVLDHGKKICEGTGAEVQRDGKVIEAYFGY
jgi:ABC-type branched-subunit amino acid transport system ATPase component